VTPYKTGNCTQTVSPSGFRWFASMRAFKLRGAKSSAPYSEGDILSSTSRR
jgi:hypothetical protein